MDSSSKSLLKLIFLFSVAYISLLSTSIEAQIDESSLALTSDALEFQLPISLYGGFNGGEDSDSEVDFDGEDEINRRSLFWKRMHYYISYGALSANRVPCPPRSGRSYYTHNCFRTHEPVHPYTRGCSRITRCRS